MADRTVYVGGGDGTLVTSPGAGSYALLSSANTGESGVDLAGTASQLTIIIEDGTYTETATVTFAQASYLPDLTYGVTIKGDTVHGATVRITTNTFAAVFAWGSGFRQGNLQDFIIDHQGSSASPSNTAISGASCAGLCERMILKGGGIGSVSGRSEQNYTIKNCAGIAKNGALTMVNRATVQHCSIVNESGTAATLDVNGSTNTIAEYCYLANGGTGNCLDEAGGALATQTAILTEDATGDTTSVAFSTANFTNVTDGAQDLSLVTGSALIDAASGSSETEDILGNARSTPDCGAYEFIAAAGGQLLSQLGTYGMNTLTGGFRQ